MAIVPILITGVVVLYVIQNLKHMSNQGKLGKKKSEGAQVLLDSLIPLGMIFGCVIGVVFGMFSQLPLLLTINSGALVGYLLGFFTYKSYSKEGNDYSWMDAIAEEYRIKMINVFYEKCILIHNRRIHFD